MEKLIDRVKAGESGAVREFYERYVFEVKAYLVVKLPEKEDVEEVLQDTFMSALDSLSLFRENSSVKTWLIAIAKHEVADFYRKRYARELVERTASIFEGVVEESLGYLGGEVATPEAEYRKKRVKEKIERVFGLMKNKYRRVLYLKYEVGMSVKEIAKEMGKSFKATESMLYRARMVFIETYEEN